MCVADFPHAPARLCAQRMTAPFRLRSRAYLDRSGLSSAVLLRVVGLARSHSAPSASARSRSSSPPLKRSSSSTRRRSIALGPVGFRSIALLLLTSAQALLVVSRPDDASDGTPSPCSCSTASPSRSPARCGAARVRPRVRQRLAPCAAYARAYREGAVVTCPGSARAAYLFLPVGSLSACAPCCISRRSRVGYTMRSNENARNARITIVVTRVTIVVIRVTIVVTRVVTPRSLRITIVVTPCPLQPHYNPVTTIVRRFSALQDKGVVTTVVTKIVILRCDGHGDGLPSHHTFCVWERDFVAQHNFVHLEDRATIPRSIVAS